MQVKDTFKEVVTLKDIACISTETTQCFAQNLLRSTWQHAATVATAASAIYLSQQQLGAPRFPVTDGGDRP